MNEFNDIISALQDYSEEVDSVINEEVEALGQEVLEEIAKNVPTKTGKYKKSFFKRKTKDYVGNREVTIGNKEYRLTHLLEDGHVTRDGTTRTKAYPHFKKANEIAEQLEGRLERRLKE